MRFLTTILFALFAFQIHAADVEWQGWSFDYSTRDSQSGLVLTNVEFAGKRVLKRASMPVMRVMYQNNICGPYADILLPGVLKPATSGAPNNACNGQSICKRTYTQNGVKMLEVGSNWQIGEYQIYQTYYFSEKATIDSRVYSRGLQCATDHSHHAHWMFDFDVDGPQNDRILKNNDDPQTVEFNDLKSETDFWTIEDMVTGNQVRLVPASDDGNPSNFAKWDLAARRYNARETGRWRYGARAEIGELFLNNESINNTDLVVWYVSHLPHRASEGDSIWHASGPRLQLMQPTDPEPPGPEPERPTSGNLLANSGFESTLAGWNNCGASDNVAIDSANPHEGTSALKINNGGCLYQEVEATANEHYVLQCQATRSGGNWSIMELGYLDASFSQLSSDFRQLRSSTAYSALSVSSTAPANSRYVVALFYSEDNTLIDSCTLTKGTTPPIPEPERPATDNLLANGDFESGLDNWPSCASANLTSISSDGDNSTSALSVKQGGCRYQEFDVTAGSTYTLLCRSRKTGTAYTSVTLALMDNNYQSLQRREVPVESATWSDHESTLTAPTASRYGAVVAYSDEQGLFDNCKVTVQQ